MLKVSDLNCGYHAVAAPILERISMTLPVGSFVCVVGRNGAGKSTLLRTLSGLQNPLSGRVQAMDENVHELHPRSRAQMLSVVTTERVSGPGLTVRDVVELGRQPYTGWNGKLSVDDHHIVATAMEKLGVSRFNDKAFDGLSDGERQRVMIARSFAQDADIMILDEITAFLDLPGRVEVMSLLRKHAHNKGKIVLLSSHDLELSLALADELWVVNDSKVARGNANTQEIKDTVAKAFNTTDVVFDKIHNKFKLSQ